MIHLYRVQNKATKHQWWCFAYQPVEAKELSVKAGKANDTRDLHLMSNTAECELDFSGRYVQSTNILEVDQVGVATLKIQPGDRVWVFQR